MPVPPSLHGGVLLTEPLCSDGAATCGGVLEAHHLPREAHSNAPKGLGGVPGLPVPRHEAGSASAPAAHHLGLAGHLGPRPSQRLGHKGGGSSAGEGFRRGRRRNAWPNAAGGRVQGRRPEAHNMADAPPPRGAPHAPRPTLYRAHAQPRPRLGSARLGPGACRELQGRPNRAEVTDN